jgi:hypothetical protein
MKMWMHPDMIEATRLTREGQLVEATALLQGMLYQSGKPAETAAGGTHAGEASEVLESEPEAGTHHIVADAGRRRAWQRMPGALRAFIGKIRRIGAKSPDRSPLAEAPGPSCPPPDGARFLTASHAGHAGTRTYKLYIPSAYRGQPLPLIVMLHGCTQSADDFAVGTRMNLVGEEHACFVAYPVQPKSANGSKCWNWFSPNHQHRGRGEPSLIAGITRQIMRDYAIDRRRGAGNVGRARSRSRMVGRQPRWNVHRSAGARCVERDGALLS